MVKPFIPTSDGRRTLTSVYYLKWLLAQTVAVRYVEPFLKGGDLFFTLMSANSEELPAPSILGSRDRELTALYNAVRTDPHAVYRETVEEAELVKDAADPVEAYREACRVYNLGDPPSGLSLYLRHACARGDFRRDSNGDLIAPPRGNLQQVRLPSQAQLLEVAAALRDADIVTRDFSSYVCGVGDVVYLDPSGSLEQFDETDYHELFDVSTVWYQEGAAICMIVPDDELIQKLRCDYWPEAHELKVNTSVGSEIVLYG